MGEAADRHCRSARSAGRAGEADYQNARDVRLHEQPRSRKRIARQGIRCTDPKKLGSLLKLMPADSTPAAPS